eukprot:6194965-Pleurochrysis_carterae.AAC.3
MLTTLSAPCILCFNPHSGYQVNLCTLHTSRPSPAPSYQLLLNYRAHACVFSTAGRMPCKAPCKVV